MSATTEFRLPRLADSVTSVRLSLWLKQEGDRVEATRLIESARARAQSAPRDVLTTLRIAAADLWEHSEQVEDEILPTRRRKSSLGRIRLVKRPDDP